MDFYEDASFLRLQDITFSYQIPKSVVEKVRLSRAEFFINVKNLATLTKWTGLDPEFLAISPINQQRAAPQLKSFVIGGKFSF